MLNYQMQVTEPGLLKKLNHTHTAIVDWMVANPDKRMKDCAEFFNYTQGWLSRVWHSDMVQAAYKEACDARGDIAVHGVAARLGELANLAMNRTKMLLEGEETPPQFVLGALNSTLERLGYTAQAAQKDAPVEQHQHLHLHADDINKARENAAQLFTQPLEEKTGTHAIKVIEE